MCSHKARQTADSGYSQLSGQPNQTMATPNDGRNIVRYKNQVFSDIESLSTNPSEVEGVVDRSYSLSTTSAIPGEQVSTHSISSLSTVTASLVEMVPIVDSVLISQPRETEEQLRRQLEEAKAENQRIRQQQQISTPAIQEDYEATTSTPFETDTEETSQPTAERSPTESFQRDRIQHDTNRGIMILGSASLAVFLAIIIVIATLATPPRQPPDPSVNLTMAEASSNTSQSSVSSATSMNRAAEIVDLINQVTLAEKEVRYDPESEDSRDKAIVWLIEEDLMQLTALNRTRLIQRFVLVSSFFGFNTNYSLPEFLYDECAFGILFSCNENDEIRQMLLSHLSLKGTIPEDIGLLTALYSLNIGNNALSGTIPKQIGRLANLTFLLLNDNILSGSIPSELGSLNNLAFLSLEKNRFTGTVPSTLANIQHSVSLANNPGLTGNMSVCEQHRPHSDPGSNFVTPEGRIVADCDRVDCPCCTSCCPNATEGIAGFGDSCNAR